MWNKIKKVFSYICAFLSIVFSTILLTLLCRSNSDRRRSTTDTERDTRVKEGLTETSNTVRRCEERLRRAEEILRGAIDRNKGEQGKTENDSYSN